MRIAISADDERGLESVVSPHFGRCPYFALVGLEGSQVKAVTTVSNPFYGNHQLGQVPAFIHRQGAEVMLTGGMSGRAVAFFRQHGIEPVTGAYGTVRNALEQYLGGRLQGAAPCAESVTHGHRIPAPGEHEKDELGRLHEEAEILRQQLKEVTERLRRLEERER
ncbi:MAG: NifB/NifX family molybdenum-iron cluster-binding protein [Thermoflexales bacterium]|nr:NifB/NifX family molybdenum-iron cluster-binding protein [Thermoflexales bacterium]